LSTANCQFESSIKLTNNKQQTRTLQNQTPIPANSKLKLASNFKLKQAHARNKKLATANGKQPGSAAPATASSVPLAAVHYQRFSSKNR
jgi:hypothetical protein